MRFLESNQDILAEYFDGTVIKSPSHSRVIGGHWEGIEWVLDQQHLAHLIRTCSKSLVSTTNFLLLDELEIGFSEGFAHLSKDFCAAEVMVSAIRCALKCFPVFG